MMNILQYMLGFGASSQPRINTQDAKELLVDKELVKILSGQLYLIRQDTARSPRCVYANAMAAVTKGPSAHEYLLVVSPGCKRGDVDCLNDGGEARSFLIGETLEFRVDFAILFWRDFLGQSYRFFVTETKASTIESFSHCIYRAMFERKYKKSSAVVSVNELQEFIFRDDVNAATPVITSDLFNHSKGTDSPRRAQVADKGTAVRKSGELYLWEKDVGRFLKQATIVGSIEGRPPSLDYYITAVTRNGQHLLSEKISSDLSPRWSFPLCSVTWNHYMLLGDVSCWCIRFKDREDLEEFKEAYVASLSRAENAPCKGKAKARGQALPTPTLKVQSTSEVVESEEDELALMSGSITPSESEPGSEGDECKESVASKPDLTKGDRNSHLAVGHGKKNNRTFVVRGDKIGMFSHSDEGKVEYAATIKTLGFKAMNDFKPKHMMLHDEDTKIILTNPLREHSLFPVDIEYGKVVDEWKVDENIVIKALSPSSKYAQISGEQTLIGVSDNALFRIDPRLGRGNVVAEFMPYASKNKFSDVTTTADGKVAVANERGEIRLFDSVGKIAKSALPAMGDPIIGIDVTDTLISDGRYAGSIGFDRPFPADLKPKPKRLQLRPGHLSYMGQNISFTPAKFNMDENQEENAIVTSTGHYVVAFDFAKIKKGKLDSYVIKEYENEVIQDNFRFGDSNEIIVALTNDVLSLDKKQLKTSARASGSK